MKPPRLRLRTLLLAVAIVAADLGLIRASEDLADLHQSLFVLLFAYVLVPALSLLVVAAVNVGLGLVKRRQAAPFFTGYFLIGILASFAVCIAVACEPFVLDSVTIGGSNTLPETSLVPSQLRNLLITALWALAQIIPGLIGGALAARYGLTIVLRGRPVAMSEQAPK